MELNNIEYFYHTFGSMKELIEYANKQIKYGTYLQSFSHVNVGPEVTGVFVKNIECALGVYAHVMKEPIKKRTTSKIEQIITMN